MNGPSVGESSGKRQSRSGAGHVVILSMPAFTGWRGKAPLEKAGRAERKPCCQDTPSGANGFQCNIRSALSGDADGAVVKRRDVAGYGLGDHLRREVTLDLQAPSFRRGYLTAVSPLLVAMRCHDRHGMAGARCPGSRPSGAVKVEATEYLKLLIMRTQGSRSPEILVFFIQVRKLGDFRKAEKP